MPLSYDVRNFTDAQREKLAWQIRSASDWKLPELSAWNWALCRVHARGWTEIVETDDGPKEHKVYDRPAPGCRKCAIHPKAHQRKGAVWLYFKKHALLADTMGSGKSATVGLLVATLYETGELSVVRDRSGDRFGGMGRVIIVPRAPALFQWRDELKRMMPGLSVVVAEGTKAQRRSLYRQPWHVLLIGPDMLRNDVELIEDLDLSLLVTDDIDHLRNPDTKTSYTLDRLGSRGIRGDRPGTDRYVIVSGTPLQKKLPELHAVLDGIGGTEALGSRQNFIRRHVRTAQFIDETGKPYEKIVGYRGLSDVKEQIAPFVLRRTAADLDGVDMPDVVPHDIYLELHPEQREKYDELKRGVITILKDGEEKVKWTNAFSQIHYGAAICSGLAALGEDDVSMKLDWLEEKLTGEFEDEKVVVFINLKDNLRAAQARLERHGIGFVTVWGEERDPRARAAAQERFWSDSKCRVLLGTKAIEQSLNLQVSRHLVNVDTILNPARMEQLAGRVRRQGSQYKTVYVHNLRTINTQEAKYADLLAREAAVAAHIWGEESELFEKLSPGELLRLIAD